MSTKELGDVEGRAVEAIESAWSGARVGALPGALDEAAGYRVQWALAERAGRRPVGWKIGCTSKAAQETVGTAGPFLGRLYADRLYDGPQEFAIGDFFEPVVEPELVIEVKTALPVRSSAWSRAEVVAAMGRVWPAFELCDSRLSGWRSAGAGWLIADNGMGWGLVRGAVQEGVQPWELAIETVDVTVDGRHHDSGSGARVLGDPIEALHWAIEQLRAQGQAVPAGSLFSTGACAAVHLASAGEEVVARFARYGEVRVRLLGSAP